MTNREAYIILNMISGVGPIRLSRLCERFGSPSAVLSAKKSELSSVDGVGGALGGEIAKWKDNIDLDAELRLVEKAGVKIISRGDAEYPSRLAELPDAPLCLYLRGNIEALSGNLLGIVGSRRISNYGRRMAEYLAASAAYAGWIVVSGLAFGADAVAHDAVVNAKGKTIAVLGGGLARIFPQDNIPLARRIIDAEGAILSEFPMEFPPNKRSFPMRNRTISGLSLGTLVIEAGSISGALITAKFALEQGRMVFAVPGEADNPQARGCNRLIRDGAKLVENFDDVLEEFEFLPGVLRKSQGDDGANLSSTKGKSNASLQIDEDEAKIIALLENGEKSADSLVVEAEMGVGELLALLMQMEMKKLITQNPGKIFSLRR